MIDRARRSRLVLGLGAALGLLLAAPGLFHPAKTELPKGVVAMVGDAPITAEDYARALAAVAGDRRDAAVDPALRRHVLDRLVDEELLLGAALASGLPLRDPALRGQIASAMVESIVGQRGTPSDDVARAHYAANPGLFSRNGRLRVEALWFGRGDTRARAAQARARWLEGNDPPSADDAGIVLPAAPLPAIKLADYLGPTVASAVARLPQGGITEPIEASGGTWLVRLVERRDGELPAYEEVREQVLADLRRAEDDAALRSWLDRRRKEARVALRDPLP